MKRLCCAHQVRHVFSIRIGSKSSFNLDLTNDSFYRYFIDNRNTANHHLVVFGLRELNESEMLDFCSNISKNSRHPITFDEPFNFSSAYEIRTYTSGCYYLDSENNWQSDGLRVSSVVTFSE
jgi:hypothetical protein